MLMVSPAPAQAPASAVLAGAVGGFLETWLVRGDAQGAVRTHLSELARDERFVPMQYYSPEEYRRIESSSLTRFDLSADNAAQRFGVVMARLRRAEPMLAPSAREALAPVDEKAIPELWAGWRRLGIAPRPLPGVPALAVTLRDEASYEWVGAETVGYRVVIPQLIKQGRAVEGVVCRIRERGLPKPWMLFTFWLNEGSAAEARWKLLGLAPVPTE
jgi:hypothetical protein